MESIFDKHEDGCTPMSPCRRCTALAFLKSKLTLEEVTEFLEILNQSDGYDMAKSIRTLELTEKVKNSLICEKVLTIADLVKLSESQVRKLPNIGRKSIHEIKEVLRFRELSLAPSEQ